VVFILVSFLSLEGCAAFRKKFIRKKKKTKEVEEEIVLEPQEYPEVIYDSATLYKNHYNFWRAWHVDLLNSLEVGQSQKKRLRAFDEVIKNLEEMENLLIEQKQQELEVYILEISENREKLSKAKLRNILLPRLKSKLRSLEKKIRNNFAFKNAKDWIKD